MTHADLLFFPVLKKVWRVPSMSTPRLGELDRLQDKIRTLAAVSAPSSRFQVKTSTVQCVRPDVSSLCAGEGSSRGAAAADPGHAPRERPPTFFLRRWRESGETGKESAACGVPAGVQGVPLLTILLDGCSFTKRVQPEVECLEARLGQRLTRLETWYDAANAARSLRFV